MNVDDIKAAIKFGESEVLPRAKVQGGDYLWAVEGRIECLKAWLDLDRRIDSAVKYMNERKRAYYEREKNGDSTAFDLSEIKKTQAELNAMGIEAGDDYYKTKDLSKFDERRHKINGAVLWRLGRWLKVE